MTKYLLPLCAALLLLPATASAAPASSGVNDEGARIDNSGPVQKLEFDIGDNVDGETLSPNGTQVGGRIAKIHESMITIRGTFSQEMIRLSRDI